MTRPSKPTPPNPNALEIKRHVVETLRAEVAHEIEVLVAAQRDAAVAATHEENRAEHSKDMRSVEASYLARGQAARVEELGAVLASLATMHVRAFEEDESVSAGALVTVDADGAQSIFFLAPKGGGLRATVAGIVVQVVTPVSPVGAALMGKSVGDSCEVETKQGRREYEIVHVE